MSTRSDEKDSRAGDAVRFKRISRMPRNVWTLTTTSFLTDVSSEMLFNLLPVFLFTVLGMRTTFIGLIEGFSAAATSLIQIISGRISDETSKRKPLTVAGYSISAFAKPLFILTTTWYGILGVRFVERLGKGIRTPPRDALLAESVDEADRGLGFGIHRAGDTLGAVVGIAIALLILVLVQPDQDELLRDTFQLIVLMSLVPALLGVVVLITGTKDIKREPATEAATVDGETSSYRHLSRRFLLFLFIVLVFSLGNSSDAFLILRASTTGLGPAGILGMMMVFNLVYALVAVPAGALSDRIGRRNILSLGWIIFALTYFGFALVSSGWQAWILIVIYGAYYGMTEGVAKAYIADLAPDPQRGRAYAAFSATVGFMALPASFLAGLLWQGWGAWDGLGRGAPFIFGALTALLSAVMLMIAPALKTESGARAGTTQNGESI